METIKQIGLPSKKFSIQKIGLILIAAIILSFALIVVVASALPSEGERTAMEIYNLKMRQNELHEQAEKLRQEWQELDIQIKEFEAELFQLDRQ